MADILLREEDLKLASTMVHTLNTILLTSTELFQLRNQLKDLKTLVLMSLGSDPRPRPACSQAPGSPFSCPKRLVGGDRDNIIQLPGPG